MTSFRIRISAAMFSSPLPHSADSCVPSAGSARRFAVLALLVLAALPMAACGKKGDPMPAPRTIPQAATDLKVRQRGLEVVVEFAYPKATVGDDVGAIAERHRQAVQGEEGEGGG